jgi:hypothetical protein
MKQIEMSAKAWIAIVFVSLFLLLLAFSSGDLLGGFLYAVIAFSMAGIAAFDSTHINLRKYKTWIAYGPIGIFVVCAMFMPIAVVWYFVVRLRIARGTMPLREQYHQPAA